MDVENSVPDLGPFSFEGKDIPPEWLDDIFPITDKWPADHGYDHLRGQENMGTPVELPAERTCHNPQGPCLSLATGLLKSMHISSPSCLLGGCSMSKQDQQQCPVDATLSTCQRSLRVMRGLLRCPCYSSPQLQLLVTVICNETIAWYWRIISTYNSSRHHPGTRMERGTRGEASTQAEAPLLRRPFFIGDHYLEGHLEKMLIGQVISSRLQELEGLAREMARKDKNGGCPMLHGVNMRRDTFLHAQLSAIRREVDSLQDETLGDD
ncbi:uncharacterized protein BCR38DRAFT_330613 [Pseudomassariella vexata]|uniref:Aflatoxin regulatory protein domain-containing protein n=1 Tax=Pseudomassariella vexata TaxID=1141098 RepID=A0A1Y2EKH9_9PEZI|nr:uncharacterized protein BCR38DRAFT_330613 [Pseudomassariella vexata]ORY71355.1 hypothetical protein BCR38DRAFT_330613 [Pseudomassariella vexata]